MSNVYRLPVEKKENKIRQGRCPACGNERDESWEFTGLTNPTFCSGASWIGRLFGGCKRMTPHCHQTCRKCGCSWIFKMECDHGD